MKKITKVVIFCLVAAILTLSLASCHGFEAYDPFIVPDDFDESKSYEISFWAKNDTNKNQVAVYNKAVADFERLYPNIDVKIKFYTDYGKIYQDVITNIPTQTTPNICITYPDHIATYMLGENIVVPLDDVIMDEKFGLGGSEVKFDAPTKDEIVPKFLKEGFINRNQYALPFMRSTEACYINKTYVEKLGYEIPEVLTWDFIFEVSAAAMEKGADGNYKVNGKNVLIPFIYKSTDNMMIQMLKQKGAGYSDLEGAVEIFNDDTKGILYTVADATKSGSFSTFKISSYPANYLNAGECIFAIDSTAGATWMGAGAPNADIHKDQFAEFETEIRIIPQYDTENPAMISQGPSMCLFNKEDAGEVLASWLFMQFLLTNDVQIGYAKTEGYIPVTNKALESAEYQDYLSREGEDNELYYDIKIKASKLFIENIDNTFITPVFNGSANLRNAAGQLIEEVAKSVRRNQTVDEPYINELYARMTTLYHLDLPLNSYEAQEFGKLDVGIIVLLSVFGAVWVFIIVHFALSTLKRRKNSRNYLTSTKK